MYKTHSWQLLSYRYLTISSKTRNNLKLLYGNGIGKQRALGLDIWPNPSIISVWRHRWLLVDIQCFQLVLTLIRPILR